MASSSPTSAVDANASEGRRKKKRRSKRDDDATAAATKRAKKPLSAVEIGKLFVAGGDVRELTARARTGEDASGSEEEDDGDDVSVPAVDVDALRASYAKSEKHVTTAAGFDFTRGFEPETATWSLLGGGGEKAAKEDAKDATETVVEEGAAVDAREVEAKRKPAKKPKRKIVRDVRPAVSRAAVLGIDEDSGIDDIVAAWRAPDEKEMLDKWHEERDNWRDDYKKKRRAALRLRKGIGATIQA